MGSVYFTEDTANFFNRSDYDEEYWNTYIAVRPLYSPDFYQQIYDYHSTHSASFASAVDVGSGPGQVAAELSSHFAKVILTDLNASHVDVARHRLASVYKLPLEPFTFLPGVSAEAMQPHSSIPAGTIDMIVAAECWPLVDSAVALSAFHQALRPGGSVAIWFYGPPIFAERDHALKCQPLLKQTMSHAFARIIKTIGPEGERGWKRSISRMSAWLDDVDFFPRETESLTDEQQKKAPWTDVRRYKWNSGHELAFVGQESCDFSAPPSPSAIRPDQETLIEKDDLTFWESEWDIHDLVRFLKVILPTMDQVMSQDTKVQELLAQLGTAMQGKRKITWPVVLLLATKAG